MEHLPAIPAIPAVTTIAQTIQLSLSPIFMLAAIGQLVNVLAGRLSRVIDRVRLLEAEAAADGTTHDQRVNELRLLDRRMTVVNAALFLGVSSAIMTCVLVALMFVAVLAKLHIGTAVALCFILAMALLIAALICFVREVRLSLRANRVRAEFVIHAG